MEVFLQRNKGFKVNKGNLQKASIIFLFVLTIIVMAAFAQSITNPVLLGFAAIMGGYMALNIGANDVANNVGPAVGSKALTMTGAIIIAAVCEISGALIAGGEVVSTVSSGIISVEAIGDSKQFVALMLAALIAGAIWINIATAIGAPVSTTHSIVGGVLGAGIAAGGLGVANWSVLGKIVGSWVISPVMGGVIAAALLFFIKHTITYKKNKKTSAASIVPYLIALMAWAFSLYLIKKGLRHIIILESEIAFGISVAIAVVVFFIVKPIIKRALQKLENKKEEINKLFTIPLIFAVALLSFAHGANDVANAIGPLTAIHEALKSSFEFSAKANVPFWIMLIGGLGISIGLALFGPRLIRTVGGEITELDQMRAYCIAMSAALTVLVASELGMPVSSTHIAIGAIFGIGFLREYLKRQYKKMEAKILESRKGEDSKKIKEFLEHFRNASARRKAAILKSIERKRSTKKVKVQAFNDIKLKKKEAKRLKEAYKEELVKRSAINKIIAAWLITVPVSAVFSAVCYFIISAIGL